MVPICTGIPFYFSLQQPKIRITPTQALTSLSEAVTIYCEMLTTPSEAVITPYETLLTLRGPSTPYGSLTTLSERYIIWCSHHPPLGLGPWTLGLRQVELYHSLLLELYLAWTSESILRTLKGLGLHLMKLFLKCGRKDLGGCGRTSEDVGPILRGL